MTARATPQVLHQNISKKIVALQRALDRHNESLPPGSRFTNPQIDLAGKVVAILVMRRTMSMPDAVSLTPRGLAAVASLIRPDSRGIEDVLADGVVAVSQQMLKRGPKQEPMVALIG